MKVGDYVRFKTLSREIKIGKIIEIIEPDNEEYGLKKACVYDLDNNEATCDDYIIKSSPNIIDLIEVGDYVNGYKVLFAGSTTWDNDGNVIDKRVKINYGGYDRWLSEDFIKSIVTKERFESMKYIIGE